MSAVGVKITDAGEWAINSGGLLLERSIQRTYSWSRGAFEAGQIHIICKLDSFEANRIVQRLSVKIGPLGLQRNFDAVMGIFTEDARGGFAEVTAMHVDKEWRDGVFDTAMHVYEDDVPRCLDGLRAGTAFNFMLAPSPPLPNPSNITADTKFIVGLELPNDGMFDALYKMARDHVEASHRATWARHLQEGWYRRRIGV